MFVKKCTRGWRWASVPVILLAGVLTGCGGGDDFGESLSISQVPQHELVHDQFERGGFSLPRDGKFNVADAQRHSEGPAEARSDSDGSGKASCAVDASKGGRGLAEFQLGHVVSCKDKFSAPCTVTFEVTYESRVSKERPQDGESPIRLKAYVMDSGHRVLGKVHLVGGESGYLPADVSGTQTSSFPILMEPGKSYELIVAGKVELASDEAPGATAELSITDLRIGISADQG